MGTDTLKNYVLALADVDESMSEPARLAVLAALEDPEVLSEALGSTHYLPAPRGVVDRSRRVA